MTEVGRIAEIWRYPVKSMGGEKLDAANLGAGGLAFDRGWAVRDEADSVIKGAKWLGGLMNCTARYLMDTPAAPVPQAEITLPDGARIVTDNTRINAVLSEVCERPVTLWPLRPREDEGHYRGPAVTDMETYLREMFALEPGESLPNLGAFPPEVMAEISRFSSPRGTYFDAFPLNVLTTASMRFLARHAPGSVIDVRRFRPNVLVETAGDEPVEFDWVGRTVSLGAVRIAAVMRCMRCVMTTRAQHELPRDSAIMRALVRESDHDLSIYANVLAPGRLAVGDTVSLD